MAHKLARASTRQACKFRLCKQFHQDGLRTLNSTRRGKKTPVRFLRVFILARVSRRGENFLILRHVILQLMTYGMVRTPAVALSPYSLRHVAAYVLRSKSVVVFSHLWTKYKYTYAVASTQRAKLERYSSLDKAETLLTNRTRNSFNRYNLGKVAGAKPIGGIKTFMSNKNESHIEKIRLARTSTTRFLSAFWRVPLVSLVVSVTKTGKQRRQRQTNSNDSRELKSVTAWKIRGMTFAVAYGY